MTKEQIEYVKETRKAGNKVSGIELQLYTEHVLKDAPKPGQLWQHFRGTIYLVVAVALEEGTLEPVVLYKPRKGGSDLILWSRKMTSWFEKVDEQPRFTPYTEQSNAGT